MTARLSEKKILNFSCIAVSGMSKLWTIVKDGEGERKSTSQSNTDPPGGCKLMDSDERAEFPTPQACGALPPDAVVTIQIFPLGDDEA